MFGTRIWVRLRVLGGRKRTEFSKTLICISLATQHKPLATQHKHTTLHGPFPFWSRDAHAGHPVPSSPTRPNSSWMRHRIFSSSSSSVRNTSVAPLGFGGRSSTSSSANRQASLSSLCMISSSTFASRRKSRPQQSEDEVLLSLRVLPSLSSESESPRNYRCG